jgi:hypothetical protein
MRYKYTSIIVCTFALVWLSSVTAQEPPAAKSGITPPATLQLAVREMLEAKPPAASVKGTVWSVQKGSGRRLVVIPLRLGSSDKPMELDARKFKPKSGRFLCWQIPERPKTRKARRPKAKALKQPAAAEGKSPEDPDPFGTVRDRLSLTMDPPRLAKTVRLDGKGNIEWDAPRVLLRGTISSPKNVYAIWAKRTLLKKPKKAIPIRKTSKETNLEFSQRKLKLQREALMELQDYNSANRFIGRLPKLFSEPAPSLIWLVYDVPNIIKDMEIRGDPPLPWTISYANLKTLQTKTRFGKGDEFATLLHKLTTDKHLYSTRAAVSLLTTTNMERISKDDGTYDDLSTLLSTDDTPSRRELIVNVADLALELPAAEALLSQAAKDSDPELSLLALRGLFKLEFRKAKLVKKAASRPTKLIPTVAPPKARPGRKPHPKTTTPDKDPKATAPKPKPKPQDPAVAAEQARKGGLLDQLIKTCHAILAQPTGTETSSIIKFWIEIDDIWPTQHAKIVAALNPTKFHPSRQYPAWRHIVELSAENSLATEWVNRQMLGATDKQLAVKTLAILATLREQKKGAAHPQHPINSADHAILKLLSDETPPIRGAAWASLDHFVIPKLSKKRRGMTVEEKQLLKEQERRLYAAFADMAMVLKPSDPRAFAFLERHLPHPSVNEQIVRILMSDAADSFRLQALTSILKRGGKKELVKVVHTMSPKRRQSLAAFWYRSQEAVPEGMTALPPIAGLLGLEDVNKKLPAYVDWFTGRIVAQHRPPMSAWTSGVTISQDETLINHLLANDPIIARSAATALIGQVAWPSKAHIDATMKNMRQVREDHAARDDRHVHMTETWRNTKQALTKQTLESVEGQYQFYLRIAPPPVLYKAGAPPKKFDSPIEKPILLDLGSDSISTDQDTFTTQDRVFNGNIVTSPLIGFQVAAISQLAAMKPIKGSVPKMEWPEVSMPMHPHANGGWVGRAELPNRLVIHLYLVRK